MKSRLPALLLVAAVVAAGIALDRTASSERAAPVASHAIDGPVLPPADAASIAWYCAEGTSTSDGRADETIIIGNFSKARIRATITVMPGEGIASQSRTVHVEALGQRRIRVADILVTPEPGVVVDVFGGPAVVEHELASRNDIAVGPCAREPSTQWYFAAGDTPTGGEQWLALYNPFGDDAIVNVTVLTGKGVRQPGDAQGVVIPRHSRVSIALHDLVRRQERVAVSIHARTGRFVAERTLRYDGSESDMGIAVSLGVTGRAEQWELPFGDAQPGVTRSLAIANFANVSTHVRVSTLLEGDQTLEPKTVDIPAMSVAHVDTSQTVSEGSGYAVSVRVVRGPPVVVEAFGAWVSPSTSVGVATTPGATAGARRWAFTVGSLDAEGQAVLSAVNISGRPLTVQVYAYTAGDLNSPKSAPAAAVPPGKRAVFRLRERGIRPNQIIIVAADGPIVAGREMLGNGASMALGVPDRS